MELQNLEIAKCFESPTNPRGAKFEGAEFDELVASVKEKGVLMPVLARLIHNRPKNGGGAKFEIIAGNRRFRAAQKAGLTEIPARVVAMTDTEVREAQIVENLQRADIHPIDEGFAYRDLIETAKLDVAGVAAKVGKSQSYIRQRLVLSELDSKLAAKVREGILPVGHAVLIARLDKAEQGKAYKYAAENRRYGTTVCDLKELREYITDVVFRAAMKSPPWKDDAQAKALIAEVTGIKGGGKTLFGGETAENIENPADYAKALAAYLSLKIEEYKSAGKPLTLVSGDYSTTTKGLKGRNEYKTGKGWYSGKCKSWHDALIVEGEGVGKLIRICTDKQCPEHYRDLRSESPKAQAEAKVKRKKEREAEQRKRDKDTAAMAAAVSKMSWPMPEAQLDVLIELALQSASHDTERQVVKRRELVPDKKRTSWGDTRTDYSGAIRKAASEMLPGDKAGLLFELLVDSYSPHGGERRSKALKML